MTRVLVTGGDGFLGGAIVTDLAVCGADVGILDCHTYASSPEQHKWEYWRRIGDVYDSDVVLDAFQEFKPDVVIHAAAETHVDRSILDPGKFIRTNIAGTHHVLQAARTCKTRVIYVSTDEVYGDMWAEDWADEDSPLKPSSPYAASKAAADMLVRSFQHTYGTRSVVVRCANLVGPWQHPEKLIPTIIRKLMGGQPIPIYGSGQQQRQWVHVQNIAPMFTKLVNDEAAAGVYNFTTGVEPVSNLNVINTIAKYLVTKPDLNYVRDRPGHDRRYAMRTNRGLHPSTIDWWDATIQWYLGNEEWVREKIMAPEHQAFVDENYNKRG